ncbi:Oligosaccharyltransferase 48 kDa subunit beta-domain-containing protein [Staphylotrichum tortipilum]|uniref:Dolichyl-diphosphooligosaccharide--protein glycosyltransferase subunit WBP1 n=1 Tax=Staphylotrichum tortipilum TaxID=2831512 RepID=A0AAN6MRU7_9PEZI|nr:Oligosaccharyltransferase 48 kDa subunit beta-domain-containing protein [Staphylotrichum longicolle]
MRSLLSLCVFVLAGVVSAISTSGNRLLVVLDDVADKEGYSQFLGDLEGRGFQLSFETPKSESLALFHLGERTYDHIIFFPTKAKGLGPNLTPNVLVDFMNANGNILVSLSADSAAPTSLVSLLSELDITLPADRTGLVVDHFNYDATSAADAHDVLLLPPPGPIRSDIKDFFASGAPKDALLAFPRGVGAALGASELLTPVLRAPSTAYSYNPKEQAEVVDDLFAAGEQLALVSVFQARNSARLALVGSAEMLQDKWFGAEASKVGGEKKAGKTFNREFAKRVSGWAFNEIGVLRVNWIEHHLEEAGASNESNPAIYRVKNDVKYTISLSEYSWTAWAPLTLPATDALQLEFSMLSPFHRLTLSPDAAHSSPSEAAYATTFKLPDQHGIFNFKVNYKRPLLSNIEEKNTVSVRHMAHDEWPRSFVISGAWPWIAGIGVTARNSEKAQSMLFRFREAQAADLGIIDAGRSRRPRAITEQDSIPSCEKWRGQVLKEISRKVSRIQDAALSDYQIRDLNDEINKLMREKHMWEVQIRNLGGPNYTRLGGGKVYDEAGREIQGGGKGYRYFGRARELPGVKELFEAAAKQRKEDEKPLEERVGLRRQVDAAYYGYAPGEEDGELLEYERAREQMAREALAKAGPGKAPPGWEPLPGDGGDGRVWELPSLEEVQVELIERRKRRLLDQI